MISKYCKRLKYQRRIVLVTDAKGFIDADGATEISKKIKQEGIELIIVYARNSQHMAPLISIGAWTLMTPSMVSRKKIKTFSRCGIFSSNGISGSTDILSLRKKTRRYFDDS